MEPHIPVNRYGLYLMINSGLTVRLLFTVSKKITFIIWDASLISLSSNKLGALKRPLVNIVVYVIDLSCGSQAIRNKIRSPTLENQSLITHQAVSRLSEKMTVRKTR